MFSLKLCRCFLHQTTNFRNIPTLHTAVAVQRMSSENFRERTEESVEKKRARLFWQSRKRGIAENCLIFSTFSAQHLNNFSIDQVETYDRLLNEPSNEWDIYYWLVGTAPVPEEYQSDVMDMLQEHCRQKVANLSGFNRKEVEAIGSSYSSMKARSCRESEQRAAIRPAISELPARD